MSARVHHHPPKRRRSLIGGANTRGVRAACIGTHYRRGVERPLGFGYRTFMRRAHRPWLLVGRRIEGAGKPRATGTSKRELIALARNETGRSRIGWKATKKYMAKLDRREARKRGRAA